MFFPSFRELIPRSSSGSLFSSPESDWLDVAMVNYGGTFLESEVNELRAMRKVVVFSFLLIPYWMIYSQVKTGHYECGGHNIVLSRALQPGMVSSFLTISSRPYMPNYTQVPTCGQMT